MNTKKIVLFTLRAHGTFSMKAKIPFLTEGERKSEKKMKNLTKSAITILLVATILIALVPVFPAKAELMFTNLVLVNDSTPALTDSGDYDDTIIITADGGITAGEELKIGWDGLKAWDGEKGVLNSTEAKGSGGFEIWFEVPEAVAGNHYIWFKDMETGETAMYDKKFIVLPKISFSPSSGLVDDKITLSGYGFNASEDIETITFVDPTNEPKDLVTTPATPESNDLGSWECTFKVPHETYGDWEVSATDKSANNAVDGFTIDPSITIDPEEGPTGTVVEITGRGFTDGEVLDGGEVTINGIVCKIVSDDMVGSDGEFKIEVVIPQTDDEDLDEYEIIVTEDNGTNDETADEEFEVTGLAEIELDPEYGVQGSTISIEGYNFTQISGKEIELWLCDYDTKDELSKISEDLDTESNGEFTGTFTVPAKSSDVYKIKAKQGDYNIEAYTSFRIGLMIVIPTPTSGPTGTEVTLTGTGFTAGDNWNATFGDIAIVEDGDVVDTDLELDGEIPTFYVPTVDPGTYTISVYDIGSEITVDVEWTVTATNMVEFDPARAPNEYNVSITGSCFNAEEDAGLAFVLYNVTSDGKTDEEWLIDVYVGDKLSTIAVELDDDGNFTGWWYVFEGDLLSLGDYILNVTSADYEDFFAQTHFTVVEKSIIVDTRKSSFAQGETVAFDITSSFAQHNSYIEIYDPAGDLYWTTDLFTDGTGVTKDMWLKIGELRTVPYYFQTAGGNPLLLWLDVPVGTWSWEWYDSEDDELDSGTFTVTYWRMLLVYIDRVTPQAGVYGDKIVVQGSGATPGMDVNLYWDSISYWDGEKGLLNITTADADGSFEVWFYVPETVGEVHYIWVRALTADKIVDIVVFTVPGEAPPEPPEYPAEITEEETLDSTGNPKTSFVLGETVLAHADVANVGTVSQPMLIVVQLTDPEYRALPPSYISVTLLPGQSLGPSLGFVLPLTGYAAGTWTAKVMVLDTWPALGGVPIGIPVTMTFSVS